MTLITLSDIARLTGVSRQAVQYWKRYDHFPAPIQGDRLYDKNDVTAWYWDHLGAPTPEWFAYMVVGTIDIHWWDTGDDFDPKNCAPCLGLKTMPMSVAEECVRIYVSTAGGNVAYWDEENDCFYSGVDFSKPCNTLLFLDSDEVWKDDE